MKKILVLLICAIGLNAYCQTNPLKDSINTLTDEQISTILEKATYPNYDADFKWIKNLFSQYSLSPKYDPRKVLAFLQEKEQFDKRAKEVEDNYRLYWLTHEVKLYAKSEMQDLFEKNVHYFQKNRETLEAVITKDFLYTATAGNEQFLKEIRALLAAAKAESDEYKSHPREGDSGSNPKDYYKDRIPDIMAKATLLLFVFEKKVGGGDYALKQLKKEHETMALELNNDAVAAYSAVKVPIETYKGADATAIKELIKKTSNRDYPQVKILKVYLTGSSWVKDSGYNYEIDENSATSTVRDESNLDAAIAIENPDNPKTCHIFFGHVNRNNISKEQWVFIPIDYFSEKGYDEVTLDKVNK